MNFKRKSTAGFSIGNILLDFSGGVANYAQMIVQSIDQGVISSSTVDCTLNLSFTHTIFLNLLLFPGSWINFYGNMGKMLLSLVQNIIDFSDLLSHSIESTSHSLTNIYQSGTYIFSCFCHKLCDK